jgi:hypothetical protein
MKEIVLVTLAVDAKTGAVDPSAPFVVSPPPPHRRAVYEDGQRSSLSSFQARRRRGLKLSGPRTGGSSASASPMLDQSERSAATTRPTLGMQHSTPLRTLARHRAQCQNRCTSGSAFHLQSALPNPAGGTRPVIVD